MALRIDRLWHQAPGWFLSLGRETQAAVLAEYRLLTETPEERKKANKAAKHAEFKRRLRTLNGH